MIKYLITLLVLFTIVGTAYGDYTVPKGIPDPSDSFGVLDPIDDVVPTATVCNNWPGSVDTDCYYIDKSHGSSTDTDNPYGYPGEPRNTPPEGEISAGTVIKFGGGTYTAADSAGDRFNWWGTGTAANPIWITAENDPVFQDLINIGDGGDTSYLILENITLSGHADAGLLIRPTTAGHTADHIVVRNCTMTGTDSDADQTAAYAQADLSGSTAEYIVFYNNTISDYGVWDDVGEDSNDEAGIMALHNTAYIWVLSNIIYHVGADSVAGCHGCEASEIPQYYYIGRNTMYENDENAVDLKGVQYAVISENVMYGPWTDAPGEAIILHSGTHSVPVTDSQVIFNEIYNSNAGVACTACEDVDIIGNLIYDIDRRDGESYAPGNDNQSGAGIRARATSGTNRIVDNTFYDVETGLSLPSSGTYKIHGNIFTARGESTGYDVYIEAGSTATEDYDQFYHSANMRVFWQNNTYTSLATYQAGETECDNCNEGDPKLTNPPSDFTLQSDSPCIDDSVEGPVGDTAYNVFNALYSIGIEKDYDGNSRPQNSVWDIGAYEYTPGGESTNVFEGCTPIGATIN